MQSIRKGYYAVNVYLTVMKISKDLYGRIDKNSWKETSAQIG